MGTERRELRFAACCFLSRKGPECVSGDLSGWSYSLLFALVAPCQWQL